MIRLTILRISRTLLLLIGVVVLTFVLGRITGDPIALRLPDTATVEDYERMRAALGLDQPIPTQLFNYFGDVLRGDFGDSVMYYRPAAEVVLERIPNTLALGLPALMLSLTLGLPLGVLAAIKTGGWYDRVILTVSLAGQSLPSFVVGIGLIIIFGVQLDWTPTFGNDTVAHYILPTLTLTLYPVAFFIRLMRSSVLEEMNADYVRTAHSKGLSPRHVLIHILRNALLPVTTVIGLQVAALLSGAAIVETVFAWPGIGLLAVESIGGRDFPVIQTIVLLTAAGFAISNMVVDLLYVSLDPRVRQEMG
jgi:peptide/nickel transport system permease protein